MEILYLAAGLSVAIWAVREWHIPFPMNIVAVAGITMVVYGVVAQIVSYLVNFLSSPAVIVVIVVALLGGAIYLLKRRSNGSWKSS